MVFKSRINVVNWPAFSSIFVMLVGPDGAGAAAEVWARVKVQEWRKIRRSEREKTRQLIIFVSLFFLFKNGWFEYREKQT